MDQVPPRWTQLVVPKVVSDFAVQRSNDYQPGQEELIAQLNIAEANRVARWTETTGLKPEDSRFTIVVPIHNEEKNLESLLGAIFASDIPRSVPYHMLFIVNGCTDNSKGKLLELLFRTGNITAETIEELSSEDESSDPRHILTKDAAEFYLIETSMASKSNALNIANEYALKQGHDIVLSLDANNYPEPDAVRLVAGTALKNIAEKTDKKIFDASAVSQTRKPVLTRMVADAILGRDPRRETVYSPPPTKVNGWCMAWSTEMFREMGGLPLVGGDDYTLSLLARGHGYEDPIEHTEARSWGLAATGLDTIRSSARWYRERLQLVDHLKKTNPEVAEVVQEFIAAEEARMGPFGNRLLALAKSIGSSPLRSPMHLFRFAHSEIAIIYGRRMYKKVPEAISWEPIGSTK